MPASSVEPIFYDPSRRRRPLMMTLGLLLSLAGTIFCISLVLLPLLPAVHVPRPHFARDLDLSNPALTSREAVARRILLRQDKARLARLARREASSVIRHSSFVKGGDASPLTPDGSRMTNDASRLTNDASRLTRRPVVSAFYVDWDETSLASLKAHAGELTHLMPEWLHLNRDAASFTSELREEAPGDPSWEALKLARAHGLAVVPLLNNYLDGAWRGDLLHELLIDPARRTALVAQIRRYLLKHRLQGINIDFEEAGPDDGDQLTALMTELHDALAPAGLLVTQDVPVEDDTYQLSALARVTDFLMPMLYDQHYSQSAPGPITPQGWFQQRLDEICRQVPADKLVLSLGNYAYDWQKGAKTAMSVTFQGAIVTARESHDLSDGSGIIHTDPASLNPHYRYYDDRDQPHQVWMLDAVTAFNQWRYAQGKRPLGVSLWYLGSEDPSLWSFFGRARLFAQGDLQALETVHYGFQIDFEGEGEILSVQSTPQDGRRTLDLNPAGIVTRELWQQFPSSYVIRRWGHEGNGKKVALTFDDGPDPEFTPEVLDVLRREKVPATFFLIGRNAEANPGLTRRIWEEGNEIGNHSFNHPNLSETSERRTDLELNATQRAIESLIGHSTPLFRPPYEADSEPSTADQVEPIRRAQALGYVMIGESIDPHDWDTAHHVTAKQIVERVMQDRGAGNCILLHDGGGDRSQTIAALPQIIAQLEARGYQFVTVSQLMGRPRAEVFPAITGSEALLVGADRFVFDTVFRTDRCLRWLFVLSIVLGLSRVLVMAVLAVIQARRRVGVPRPPSRSRSRSRPLPFPNEPEARGPGHAVHEGELACPLPSQKLTDENENENENEGEQAPPLVTVLIAAYNEATVIRRTVETVLRGTYQNVEVVVVDDGSADGTAEVARAAFAGEARVRVIEKENGGKASALNLGLEHAQGEVIVALDADTLFDRHAVERLVRHFADPQVGAVAGNVKVGNATNLLTRWQAIEYITSQNFDRRAYDLLNCITVVPGAVGAWRRAAIAQAGGYSRQTLAEDTDLTWTIRKLGYRIVTENEALAYTEAPDSLRALAKQRFRWAFGTLQNLWKHRDALLNPRYGAFGLLALPGLWLYQILFQTVAPAVDLMILSSLWMGDVQRVLFYYALFFLAELMGGLVAFSLEREDRRLLLWLFFQRFVYRQLMYYVIVRSVLRAVGGTATSWGKLERKGTSRVREEAVAER